MFYNIDIHTLENFVTRRTSYTVIDLPALIEIKSSKIQNSAYGDPIKINVEKNLNQLQVTNLFSKIQTHALDR